MKLISAVKLQHAQDILLSFRPYSDAFRETAMNISMKSDPRWHPLLRRPDKKERLHIVFMTSDRGLCGSFNSNLIRKVETYLVTDAKDYEDVKFSFLGRRGRDHFSRNKINISNVYTGINQRNFSSVSQEVATKLTKEFLKGESDEILLIYNYFRSALSQVITFERILPMETVEDEGGGVGPVEYLYEPSRKEVLDYVLPKYVQVRVERAFQESLTSEHAARMTAMENATSNADDVIRKLTLLFNKTRQAIITRELMDIVNGTEALRKGGMD